MSHLSLVITTYHIVIVVSFAFKWQILNTLVDYEKFYQK